MRLIAGLVRGRGSASGQALPEFALVAPIFFLLMFGVIQLGLLLGGQNGLVNAVRETARYAATYRVATQADAQRVCNNGKVMDQLAGAMARALPGYEASKVASETLTYTWLPNPDGTYYIRMSVGARYKFPLYVPLLGAFLDQVDGVADSSAQLGATEEMRIENDALTATYGPVTC